MAIEVVGYVGKNAAKNIKLAENLTVANAVPTVATDGIATYPKDGFYGSDSGHCYTSTAALTSTLLVDMTGTTPSFTFTLWGYLATAGKWYPIKVFTAMTANTVTQGLQDLGHFDRLYLQATAVTGTTPSANAYLVTSRTVGF